MKRQRAALERLHLLLVGVPLVLTPAALAQDEALYPALDVPSDVARASETADASAAAAGAGSAAEASATATDFDASHFTPSPNPNVRDLDGDGHLDGLSLLQGVHVWLGHGDGRFDPGTLQVPSELFNPGQLYGQWGDVNGDGRLDAVFVDNDRVDVFIDQGDGSFASSGAQVVPSCEGLNFTSIVAGPVNGDAFADLVGQHSIGGTQWSLGIIPGTGAPGHGWFGAPLSVATTVGSVDKVGLGDLDGNGLIDIVASGELNNFDYKIGSWTQGPAGTFTSRPPVLLSSFGAQGIAVRDMTGDGLADVVLDRYGELDLFVCNGSGSLPTSFTVLPGVVGKALFVDVDQDGLVDVLEQKPTGTLFPAVLLAQPDGSLSFPVTTPHTALPIGSGDFDEDGLLDLWSLEAPLLGRGDGSFGGARNFRIGTDGDDPQQLAYADFNEDGTPDLVTVDDGFGIFATLSDVGATWRAPLGVIATMASISVATGDLDGDGHQDILAGRAFLGNADICLGNGSGDFQTFPENMPLVFGGQNKTGIGIGRFDASAPADVVACAPDGEIRVRLGQGNLVFGPIRVSSLAPGFTGTPWLVVCDLDGDGLDDLLVLQHSGIHSYRCIGSGLFAAGVAVTTDFARTLTVTDLDDDGDDDLIAVDDVPVGDQLVWAVLGDGAGHFVEAPWAPIDSALVPRGAAAADVDGDSLIDLAIGHENAWSLHLGTPGGGWEPLPTDVFDLPGTGRALRFLDANLDGLPDLLAAGSEQYSLEVGHNQIGLTLALHSLGPWEDLGFGLATATSTPYLFPKGSLQPSTPFGLVLRDGKPNAPAWFICGLTELSLAFKGGVLVPSPLLLLPAPALSSTGKANLLATWPAGVPSGTRLWIQAWISDSSGPAGFTASNAVVGTTP